MAHDFPSLVLAARDGNGLKEVADAVKKAGAEPLVCALDLSKTQSFETVVNTKLDRFGRIDALLIIAGAVPQIDLFEMTDEQWRAGAELKLFGARRLTIGAWEALKSSKGSVAKQFPEKAGISRYGEPEEIADLLAFMVSPAARWMTVTSVRTDGGEIKGI